MTPVLLRFSLKESFRSKFREKLSINKTANYSTQRLRSEQKSSGNSKTAQMEQNPWVNSSQLELNCIHTATCVTLLTSYSKQTLPFSNLSLQQIKPTVNTPAPTCRLSADDYLWFHRALARSDEQATRWETITTFCCDNSSFKIKYNKRKTLRLGNMIKEEWLKGLSYKKFKYDFSEMRTTFAWKKPVTEDVKLDKIYLSGWREVRG